MRYLLIILSIGLIVSYNRKSAVKYAKKWCNKYNPKYKNYNPDGGDCANFVSQCLIAGGMNLVSMCGSGAAWGQGGTVPAVADMRNCFQKNGWSSSSSVKSEFKMGDVVLYDGHATFAISGHPKVLIAAHNKEQCSGSPNYRSGAVYWHYKG